LGLQCFEFLKMFYKELNFINDNNSYWLGWLIYLFMINEHIISIEFGLKSFNATCDFNTKACSSKGKILMNWNVRDEWYNVKKAQGKQQIEQPFVGH
jgi:hypothetical protein